MHTSVTDKPVHLVRLCLALNILDLKYVTSKAMVCLFYYFLTGTHLTLTTYNKIKERALGKQGCCLEFVCAEKKHLKVASEVSDYLVHLCEH